MKKYFNLLFLTLAVVVGFSACSDDDDDYKWATVTGNQVYFSNQLPTKLDITNKANSFNVPINRVKTDEAITVNLAHTDQTGFFNVPASVQFAPGQAQADITITYDPEKVTYDNYVKDTIKIASADYTTVYGASSYAFSAGMPSPFKSLGYGKITDTFFGFGPAPVLIMQNTETPNVFRLFGAYDAVNSGNEDEYLQITLLKPGDVIRTQTVAHEGLVFWDDFNTGYFHPSYEADVMLYHPSLFTATNPEENWLFSRVLDYQANGLPGEIQLAPRYYMEGVGGWNYSQRDGVVSIIFPGYDKKDFTVEAEYMGRLTSPKDVDYAQFNITLGADLESVNCAVTDGDPEELAQAIIDGTTEFVTVTETSTFSWPLEESGNYTLVMVGYAGGEVVATEAMTFKFTSSHENVAQFSPVGIGTYTYTQFWEGDDEGLEISKSDADDTYKISHWGYDVDFYFTWDKTTNQCQVAEQFTGYTHSSYGDVYVSDLPHYTDQVSYNDYPCYYDPETGTFTFNLIYYVSAGYFGMGAETFTVQWNAAAAPARVVSNKQIPYLMGTPKKMVRKHFEKAAFDREAPKF